MAWLFARLGASVAIAARDQEKLAEVQAKMREQGLNVHAYGLNIKEADDVRRMQSEVIHQLGGFDVLINSAGGQFPLPAMDISDNGWRAVIDTNLNGTWYMMQAAARYWRDQKMPGNIINIATVIDRGMVNMAHTCAARAGVIYLAKTVAVEWSEYNIRVNNIAPGVIASEGMRVYSDEARAKFPNSNPMKRFGSAWEVAQAAVYLASEASAFTTGDTLTVDGGGRLWGELWTHSKPDYFNV